MTVRTLLPLAVLIATRLVAADSKTAPAAAPAHAPAESATTPTASFEAFRLIGDRNIFNPNRTGRRERTAGDAAPRVETISLVGTMDSERGLYAFFEGSDAAYRKALRPGESLAQFKVSKIAADGAELERDGTTYAVKVGQQFRRPEGADWSLVAADVARSDAAATRATETTAAPAVPSDASETLKRLMEQRQKQLKQ